MKQNEIRELKKASRALKSACTKISDLCEESEYLNGTDDTWLFKVLSSAADKLESQFWKVESKIKKIKGIS
jgi:hypothetical protein